MSSLKRASLVAALALASSASVCDYQITNPVLGYETTDVDCRDQIDNDADGAIDC
jgi:hypothetical protein